MLLSDACSYERQKTHLRRRRQLLTCALWLTCSAFTWPGRAAHLSYTARHGSTEERVEALRLLEEDEAGSSEAILSALEDDASEVRAQAASSAIAARESRALGNLLDLAAAKDAAERQAALRALGQSGSPRAQATLERALHDPVLTVRITALEALAPFARGGSFDGAKLTPLLNADDPLLRAAALELLDQLPPPSDAAAFAARSSQLRKAARDKAAAVRAAALRAMGHAKDARFLPDLQASASDADESVRLWAMSALGDSNIPGAVDALWPRAGGAEVRAAYTALAALGRIDDPSATAAIAQQLTRPVVAQTAADALLTRARRLHHEDLFRESGEALRRAIESTADPEVLGVLARALVDLASVASASGKPAGAPLAAAQRGLLHALEVGRGDVTSLTQCLIELREPAILAALIERRELQLRAEGLRPSEPSEHAALTAREASSAASIVMRQASETPQPNTQLAVGTRPREGAPAALSKTSEHTTPLALLAKHDEAASPVMNDRPEQRTLLAEAAGARAVEAAPVAFFDAVMATLRASTDVAALIAEHGAQLKQLLERTGAPLTAAASVVQLRSVLGLDTAEAERSPELRRALAELWAELPHTARPARGASLLAWLDDPDERVRERSSIALARTAGAAELAALATRLEQHAPYPVLTLQACAGALLRTAAALPAPLRERLLQQLKTYLEQPDEALAMNALFALRASRDPRAARWIAALLRGRSAPLRAAALQALGDFAEQDARRLLRDTLRGDNVQAASSAALALAELGSDRDVPALLRAAERGSWPLQPSAAYASARITQRAQTRKHSLERELCRFAQQRDSYVLANSVSALAALGAPPCDEHIAPNTLLDPSLPSALRVAAATWLRATHAPAETEATAAQAVQGADPLTRCAEDHDPAVAKACVRQQQSAESSGRTLLKLFEADGRTPLCARTVALRLPNASIYIGRSDNAGQLLLPVAVHGEIVLEDPADSAAIASPQAGRPRAATGE